MEPYVQQRIPYWYAPLVDERTGRWITSHVVNQDFVAWVGQGVIADRTQEHLGESDRGITLLRRRLLEEAKKVEQGQDPKAIIRDAAHNVCVQLPTPRPERFLFGQARAELAAKYTRYGRNGPLEFPYWEFPYFAGQPDSIRQEFLEAMGLAPEASARQLIGARSE
jgi:5,5'-dehydrodivanillate O-demethylase